MLSGVTISDRNFSSKKILQLINSEKCFSGMTIYAKNVSAV
jgi:hypothetical protein